MATAGVPLWSTTAASNATADPAVNMAEGMAPSAVNDSVRALMASVAKWRGDLYGITTGGTSTAFTLVTGSTFASTSAMSGAIFTIIPHATSGASATLAVDSLTAYQINISTGVAVPTGALISGTPYLVKYVHASTEFIVMGAIGVQTLAALNIIGATSETALAVDDTIPLYDLSATANRRMLVSDFLKVVNLLTADASPDKTADYVMTYDTSASAAKKVLLQNLPSILPRGYIDGCIISNGTDATNDINIAAGVCRDSTNAFDITVAAMSGKQLDANWVAGASAGMRNSAVGIADTTYHIYAVATAAGVQDIYAHTSTTVATVITALQAESGGSSYVYARRIGSIMRESSALVGFVQFGDEFVRKVPSSDSSGSQSTTAALIALKVPLGVKVKANMTLILGSITATGATTTRYFYLSSPDATDSAAASGLNTAALILGDTGSSSITVGAPQSAWTNTSSEIRIRADASVSYALVTLGWVDLRGSE